MADVTLLIDDLGPHPKRCVALLAKEFSLSIPSVENSIADHRPIAQKKLFDRHDEAFPRRLLHLLTQLDALSCRWTMMQVLDGQEWPPDRVGYQITIDRLQNMIADRIESMEEQRRHAEREAGE